TGGARTRRAVGEVPDKTHRTRSLTRRQSGTPIQIARPVDETGRAQEDRRGRSGGLLGGSLLRRDLLGGGGRLGRGLGRVLVVRLGDALVLGLDLRLLGGVGSGVER